MISSQYANDVQAQRRGVTFHQRVLVVELQFDLGQLLQNLNAHVDETENIQCHFHQIEQKRHVLLHRQIIAIAHGKAVEHLLHGDGALPGHHILIEIGHCLEFAGGRLEIEFTA